FSSFLHPNHSLSYLISLFILSSFFFFFNATATTEIYTLSLHDALPISPRGARRSSRPPPAGRGSPGTGTPPPAGGTARWWRRSRSEEHTSELQSRGHLVCRLLLEKKKKKKIEINTKKIKKKTHKELKMT